ncbi:hypothetical protein ONS96_004201 [Cadophora gregata f. sp. sojae]|nr:hypothetical protein ONS96_004201 [Cadophora gregata f. sp. sojae]
MRNLIPKRGEQALVDWEPPQSMPAKDKESEVDVGNKKENISKVRQEPPNSIRLSLAFLYLRKGAPLGRTAQLKPDSSVHFSLFTFDCSNPSTTARFSLLRMCSTQLRAAWLFYSIQMEKGSTEAGSSQQRNEKRNPGTRLGWERDAHDGGTGCRLRGHGHQI